MKRTTGSATPGPYGKATHPGETGKNNEDRGDYWLIACPDSPSGRVVVAVVADGIGGQNAGEQAAELAVQTVGEHFRAHPSAARVRESLRVVLEQTNSVIYQRSQEQEALRGMGTTSTVTVMADGELHVANVGDSRCYLIRGDTITQLTVDHTWAQEAIEAKVLSVEEARRHPNRNVLKRYLGINPTVDVDLRVRALGTPSDQYDPQTLSESPVKLEPGDVVLLCSDGLTDLVPDHELLAAVAKYPPQRAADQLVQMARSRGGHDNITVLVLPYGARAAKRAALPLPILAGVLGLLALLAVAFGVFSSRPKETTPVPTPPQVAAIYTATKPMPAETTPPSLATVTSEPASPPTVAGPIATTAGGTEGPTSVAPPTRTPVPTRTATPTAQRIATPTEAPKTSDGTRVPGAPAAVNVPTLLSPEVNATRGGEVEFSWRPHGPLPSGAAYEVVWWHESEPADAARGIADPTPNTALKVNVNALGGQGLRSPNILWTVLIVQPEPYRRLTRPAEGEMRPLRIECPIRCETCERTVIDPATGGEKKEQYACNCRSVCD